MLEHGNHKSAEENNEIAKNLTQDNINKGFIIPLPCSIALLVKNREVYLVGLANNNTFDKNSISKIPYRLTHNLSFPIKKGIAINNWVEKGELSELRYGIAFL